MTTPNLGSLFGAAHADGELSAQSMQALTINANKEFERNTERYEFLKWGQQSLNNFTCLPPATGIVHLVTLEYLATGVLRRDREGVT